MNLLLRNVSFALAVFAGLGSLAGLADEKKAESTSSAGAADEKETPDAKQIERWIKELNGRQLAPRMKAREELVKAGAASVPSLVVAAGSDNADVREKAVSVLGVLLESKDKDAKEAAVAALQLLAESELPTVADLAKRVMRSSRVPGIAPEPEPEQSSFSRVSVSVVNGVKTIDAEEDGRKVHIHEDPAEGIEIEIVEGDETTKLKVKDAAELKKKNPKAHKVYEQFTAGKNGNAGANALRLRVGPGGGNINGQSSFSFSSGFSFGNNQDQANANFNINNAVPEDHMNLLIEHLEELKDRLPDNAELHRMIDEQIRQLKK